MSYIRRIKLYLHHHRWLNIISKVPIKPFLTILFSPLFIYLAINIW